VCGELRFVSDFEPFLNPYDGVAEELRAVIEPALAALGLELWHLVYVRAQHRDTVRIMAERTGFSATVVDSGISMADLEKANRVIGDALDVEDAAKKLFPHAYELEVGSPGVDRPLTKVSHFQKNVGAKVKVKTKVAHGSPSGTPARSFSGTLGVDDKGIRVDDVAIPFEDIQSAHIVFVFEAPQKPGKGSKPGQAGKPGKPGKKQK
jgi:ribosome maturation factor RimP